jgi:FAD synthase
VARGGHGGRRRQARHRARLPDRQPGAAAGTALAHGIYAVRVYFDGRRLDGAAYLGTRPTFDDGEAVLEVFLFDFDGDLYGRQIEVEFIGFVRADAKFAAASSCRSRWAGMSSGPPDSGARGSLRNRLKRW